MQIDSVKGRDDPVPDEAGASVAALPQGGSGDQAMIHEMQDFFDALFLKKDSDKAFSVFASSTYSCAGPSLAAVGSRAAGDALREKLKQIARRSPASNNLEHVIEGFDPENPTLKTLEHPDDKAYLLAIVPDSEVPDFLCNFGVQPDAAADANVSVRDSYYGTFFKLAEPGDEPAALGLLWSKREGVWKIVAYRMDEP
jgi:hypothetical protein